MTCPITADRDEWRGAVTHNPPAFPVAPILPDIREGSDGMSLRDWFAGQCDVSIYSPLTSFEAANGRKPTISEMAEYITSIRFIEADAMLLARAHTAAEGGE